MKKQTLIVALLTIASVSLFAQNSDGYKPNGKATAKIYTDFTSTSSNGATNNGFDITRAYFGYGYNFSQEFSGKVLFDIAKGQPSAYTAYLKNAYGQYSANGLKVDLGLVGTKIFSLQEGTWGKRYLYKSFQDNYGFEGSADLGLTATYKFADAVSADFSFLNGEGYKHVQADSAFLVGLGVTLKPVKSLSLRVYGDYSNNGTAQTSFNAMLSYKADNGANISAEYDMQNGHAYVAGHDYSGFSVYGTVPFAKKYAVFARFDDMSSANSWNSKEGQVYIAGLQLSPVKGILISPNFRYSNFANGTSNTVLAVNAQIAF